MGNEESWTYKETEVKGDVKTGWYGACWSLEGSSELCLILGSPLQQIGGGVESSGEGRRRGREPLGPTLDLSVDNVITGWGALKGEQWAFEAGGRIGRMKRNWTLWHCTLDKGQ